MKAVNTAIIVIGLLLLLAVGLMVHLVVKECHGQCANGDRGCQSKCFQEGICPAEDR